MTEVITVKFKNRGKGYFFGPDRLSVNAGDKVIVETSKGLELADCVRGNHPVEDSAVVQPLRPVIRIATEDDLLTDAANRRREKEAFEICREKIAEHGLDMKLVDVECNFEGSKTLFFFTSDGRVDFRDLVKDLAGIFRNRIELRQIGVRDEAKMIGGLGICGQPYCCGRFLEEFQPVSTKMAKTQSLSLNPAKISGSCGRLMCCLRYEQEAYEALVKKMPKQGSFVQTVDGYGTVVQADLLHEVIKVRLDGENEDTVHVYKSNEFAAVPGGRPKEGEPYPSVLNYVPEEEEPEQSPSAEWEIESPAPAESAAGEKAKDTSEEPGRSRRHRNRGSDRKGSGKPAEPGNQNTKSEKPAAAAEKAPGNGGKRHKKTGKSPASAGDRPNATKVAVKVKDAGPAQEKKASGTKPAAAADTPAARTEGQADAPKKKNSGRRHYYHGKPKQGSGSKQG